MTITKPAILSLPPAELEAWLAAHDAPAYRRQQVLGWARARRGVVRRDARRAAGRCAPTSSAIVSRHLAAPVARTEADSGLTTKTLYELDGGHSVEAVVMRYSDRSTLCISSQAGCPIGCPFCATGKFPFGRNLKAHEIVEQAVDAARLLTDEGRRLSHVVFMGMGEPMANYRRGRRVGAADVATRSCLGISPRRIVVSTSGLIPRIEQLAAEKLPVTLAISLHAARDELRDVLVPINRKYPVHDLVDAAQGYAETTGRRVSYEWVMLAGVNDTERDAKELGALLQAQARAREPDPVQPGRRHAVPSARSRLRSGASSSGSSKAGPQRHCARHPRARGRRRVRPAARARSMRAARSHRRRS